MAIRLDFGTEKLHYIEDLKKEKKKKSDIEYFIGLQKGVQ